jgi:signal transduction histidine kinase
MAAAAHPALVRLTAPPQLVPRPPHHVAALLPGVTQRAAQSLPAVPGRPAVQGRAVPSDASLERRRLARELHDGVMQQVLAAGLTIDWCMGEVPAGSPVHEQLAVAKRLTRDAARTLRSSLHELTQATDGNDEDLPEMLARLLDTHATPRLRVSLHVRGTSPPLPPATRQWLRRFAGECLFNSAVHSDSRHAAIRLRYDDGGVVLSVADDGHGRPKALRKVIAGEVPGAGGGCHFGLSDIAAQAREMGWTVRVSRADLGGIAMEVRLPAGQVPVMTGETDG